MNLPDLIDEAMRNAAPVKRRRYIGASAIGSDCLAEISYAFRLFPETPPDPQLKRIFFLGHRIEDIVLADMKRAGVDVISKDPWTGDQFEYEMFGGHVQAHADGQVVDGGDVMLLEIKSMNDSKWGEFLSKGVARSHPRYQAQMQFMMGMSGITKCLFVAYNKNNSKYHSQIVEFDAFEYAALVQKTELVLRGDVSRVASDRSDWRCKGCFQRDSCWFGILPETRQCRNCQHVRATDYGGWLCEMEGELTESDYSCSRHEWWEPLPRA